VKWQSALAVYFLFFVGVAFVMLPFGVRTDEEAGTAKVAGQADSAPHRFDLKRHLLISAVVSVAVFAVYYLNYLAGWITAADLDFYNPR
jgi:predicted secreted protein